MAYQLRSLAIVSTLVAALHFSGCGSEKINDNIFGQMGEPFSFLSESELQTFERGKELVMQRRNPEAGGGPDFNVTFCMACHEKPVLGGGAGRYRNFQLVGIEFSSGNFRLGGVNGIQRQFTYETETRVESDEDATVLATRNAIPIFGVGLISAIYEDAILKNVDENDADGDGISGRPNFEPGNAFSPGDKLGRFGLKAQSGSIEPFVRGPLFNHLGITTVPLNQDALSDLLFSRNSNRLIHLPRFPWDSLFPEAFAQGTLAPANSRDSDGVSDPEIDTQDLFDIVSFSMMLAAPRPDEPTQEIREGEEEFREIGCAKCHVPTLSSSRGLVPLFSDLLLHDMGPDLADGIEMGTTATGSEFRTQPLWGVVATGPYLHDGRADTLDEAIRFHGGEAEESRENYEELSTSKRERIIEFLSSLGGRSQLSEGLLEFDAPVPDAGEFGGPRDDLSTANLAKFEAGRALFDRDFFQSEGLGPKFNGDSCRACHFDPVIGGSGPADVNVMRNGTVSGATFTSPAAGTILHRFHMDGAVRNEPEAGTNLFEMRQPPALFGLGLIDLIPRATIEALEDPSDADVDGISGRAHVLGDGSLGRFGWKANVPTLADFSRDAMTNEMGLTVPASSSAFGATSDSDEVDDPEISATDLSNLTFFMSQLAPPPRTRTDEESEDEGEALFSTIGCNGCHTPSFFVSGVGTIRPYSDFLLHDVAPDEFDGIEDGDATMREFRTPPLWGISKTAPYMHDGRSSDLEDAILRHEAEGEASRQAFEALSETNQNKVILFLLSL